MCSQLSISMGSTSTDSTSTVCSLLNPWVWNVLKWRGRQYTHMCGCKYRIYIFFNWGRDVLLKRHVALWNAQALEGQPIFFFFSFYPVDLFCVNFLCSFSFNFFGCTHGMWNIPRQVSNLCHNSDPSPALTAPDPKSTAPQENSCLVSILSLVEPQELKRGRGRNFSFLTYISSLTPGSVF